MLAAQQRLQGQDRLGHWEHRSEATRPYVRAHIILTHPFAASRRNQGERPDVREAEANRAVFTGVEI